MENDSDIKQREEYKPPKKKRRKTSSVWNYFSEPEQISGRGTIVRCSICNWEMKYSSSTSGLRNHLTSKHNALLDGRETSKSPEEKSKQNTSVEHNLALWLSSSLLPSEHIDNHFFQQCFQSSFNYGIPTAHQMRVTILPTILNEIKNRSMDLLSRTTSVSLTIETWNSYYGEQFVGIYTHFLDSHDQPRHLLMDIKVFPYQNGNQLKNSIDSVVEFCLLNQNLRIFGITLENGPDQISLHERQLTVPVFPCISSFLQATISTFFQYQQIGDYIASIRSIISIVINSSEILASIIRLSQQSTLLASKDPRSELKLDNPSKWITTVTMMEGFLNYFSIIPVALQENHFQPWSIFSGHAHLEVIRHVYSITQPFCKLVSNLMEYEFPSVSLLIPMLQITLRSITMDIRIHSLPIFDIFQATTKPFFDSFVHKIIQNDMLLAAAALDLRFKDFKWLDFDFQLKSTCFHRAKDWLTARMQVFEITNNRLANFDAMFYSSEGNPEISAGAQNEILNYFNENELNTAHWSKFDSLAWWREKRHEYPLLYKIAVPLLLLPTTCATSEFCFSSGSGDLEKQRASTSVHDISTLFLIRQNISLLD